MLKLTGKQKTVGVQDLSCGQMRVSGFDLTDDYFE
jgi:hypothetical protein